MTSVVAFDHGWATTREAEHETLRIASDAGLPVTTACTHFVTDPPRVVVTVETPAPVPPDLGTAGGDPAVDRLVDAHRSRQSGRVFVLPGAAALPGELTLSALLDSSLVDRVLALGGQEPSAATLLLTQRFLRPEFVAGELVLRVRPADGGTVVPFEQPSPTPCCTDHC